MLDSYFYERLLGLADANSVRFNFNAVDLDPSDKLDKELLDELACINKWAGLNGQLVYWNHSGTAAHPSGLIGINKQEVKDMFSSLSKEGQHTAIFMALAHEAGHLCQLKWYRVTGVFNKPRIRVEAHADTLSGVWLALRLASGEKDTPENVFAAAEQLNSSNPSLNYPSTKQRIALVQEGQGLAAGVILAEHQGNVNIAARLSSVFKDEDLKSLYRISGRVLGEVPDTDRTITEESLLNLLADLNDIPSGDKARNDPELLKLVVHRVNCIKVEVRGERGRHLMPHFHIKFKENLASSYRIDNLEKIVGNLPPKYEALVAMWIKKHKNDLSQIWNDIISGKRPDLVKMGIEVI